MSFVVVVVVVCLRILWRGLMVYFVLSFPFPLVWGCFKETWWCLLHCSYYCQPTRLLCLTVVSLNDMHIYTSLQPFDTYSTTCKLQALVYDILPSTTAVFNDIIGSWKLSANEQFSGGVQKVVSLLLTTQIKQGMLFIAANKVYTSRNKTTIIWIETELFFSSFLFYPGWIHLMFAWVLGCFHSHISTQTFLRRWTAARR